MYSLVVNLQYWYVCMQALAYSSDTAILSSVHKPFDFFTDLSLARLYSSIQLEVIAKPRMDTHTSTILPSNSLTNCLEVEWFDL